MGLTQLFNNAPKVTVSSLLLSQHPQQGPFPSLVSRCISKQHVLKVKHERGKRIYRHGCLSFVFWKGLALSFPEWVSCGAHRSDSRRHCRSRRGWPDWLRLVKHDWGQTCCARDWTQNLLEGHRGDSCWGQGQQSTPQVFPRMEVSMKKQTNGHQKRKAISRLLFPLVPAWMCWNAEVSKLQNRMNSYQRSSLDFYLLFLITEMAPFHSKFLPYSVQSSSINQITFGIIFQPPNSLMG